MIRYYPERMLENTERGVRDDTSLWQVTIYYIAEEDIGRTGNRQYRGVAKDNLTAQEAIDEANRLTQERYVATNP